jgi:hypothetical protein
VANILSSEPRGLWRVLECFIEQFRGGLARGALDFVEYIEAQSLAPDRHLERFRDDPHVVDRLVHGDLRLLEPRQAPHRHHCRTHRTLDREADVRGRLDILADEREIHAAFGNDLGPVRDMAGHELAGDVGHRRHRHECLLEGLPDLILVESVMIEDLGEDLVAGALPNGLLDEVARPVGPQQVAVRYVHVVGLAAVVVLAVDEAGGHPAGILDRGEGILD